MEGAGITLRRALLSDLSPIESYSLNIRRQSAEAQAWGSVTAGSSSLLAQTLTPYIVLSEAYPGARRIEPEANRLSMAFNFYATRKAAEAVAAAFPEDKVISRIGYEVKPPEGGGEADSRPGPAP